MPGGGGGGGNKPPPRELYRPGSGPLRKSGRLDDYDHENIPQDKHRMSSVQDRLKPSFFNNPHQPQNSSRSYEIESIRNKLNALQVSRNHDNDHGQSSSRDNHTPMNDSRKKSKKPEQQLYVHPKKVRDAVCEPDIVSRSTHQNSWDRDRERSDKDWELPSNRNQRNNSRSNPGNFGGNHNDNSIRQISSGFRGTHNENSSRNNYGGSHADNSVRNRDEHSKRFTNRRNRNTSENDERLRGESPASNRTFGSRNRDRSRELRQGSEASYQNAKNSNDINRMRDIRSVESYGYAEKFQGKPPSGKRGKDVSRATIEKYEALPPRLRAKFIQDHGLQGLLPLPNSSVGTTSEGCWDGSTVTFQGSAPQYPPNMQHSKTVQNFSSSGPASLPPQSNWSNTVPARSRGRGRIRPDEPEGSTSCRPATPDQYSAPSSRSHTPSQEYVNRSYDRRGSNSTMHTSMESLSRDSILMPPPVASPGSYRSNATRCVSPSNNGKKELTPSVNVKRSAHQTQKTNNDIKEKNSEPVKETIRAQQEPIKNSDKSPEKSPERSEPSSPIIEDKIEVLNWYEEVELSERLEAEQMSRSSSVMSLRENTATNVPSTQPSSAKNRSRKSRKKTKRRDKSKDKIEESSRERQNNQYNRENDNYNNNQKNTVSGHTGNKRFENRRRNSHRSRDSSNDKTYRGGSRGPDDFCRNRSQNIEVENWRTGRTSICESDDGRRTPLSHASLINNSGPSSIHRQSPTSYVNSQPPGVLVLPEQASLQTNSSRSRQLQTQHQKRKLFDPNNPNKPIMVTSHGNRVGPQHRENEMQAVNTPPLQSPYNMSPVIHQSFQSTFIDNTSRHQALPTEPYGSMRPLWYDPYTESFRSAKNPHLLLDIERADLELQFILSSRKLVDSLEQIDYIRSYHQKCLQTLLLTDLKFCQAENVEQHFWKIMYYNIIEILRKPIPQDDTTLRERYKKILLKLCDEGTSYFTSLLVDLENTYSFRTDEFLSSLAPPKGLGMLGLALVSVQKIFLFLGDLARYKELAHDSLNYGKSRQWYLKAQQINPKNGRPYSQLALLATYARKKLDAVYYYMRSLMASNPFPSARESLITMFDENRKKYESTERKRKEERESKERARMKEKEGSNYVGGGLRREIWIHPDGKRMRRTTSASATNDSRYGDSDVEDLSVLTSTDLNKRFITSYLHVHGKLITRIGMETFQEAAIQMLREFRTLLHMSPLPIPDSRLLQLLALNMFAIETTQLKDSQMEQGYRSEVQERALVVSLQMFSLILERSVCLLKTQLENDEHPKLIVVEDMEMLLPSIKIWCDWMLCHSTVWNPPPSCTDYRVGPPGDAWSRLAALVNLLEKLDYSRDILIQAKDAEGRDAELNLVRLPEDTTLSGFTPLMSNPLQDPFYADKKYYMELAQVALRIHKILFFGQFFLCGLETPVLKLQKNPETGDSEYVSVVETSTPSSPGSPPDLQSDSELMVESYSEDDESSSTSPRVSVGDTGYDSVTSSTTAPAGEIRSLIERKEALEKRQRRQDRHRQRVQAILQKSSLSVEIEVRPKHLVPDTNCFIDFLPQLQSITKATCSAQPVYTLMVPLVVLNELEGLSKGTANLRDSGPTSRAALNPEHVARVTESAKAGLAFARSRNPAIRCLTTRGTVLTSSSFTVEEDINQDGLALNDDRILATCLSLCKSTKDHHNEEGQPRRVKRDVVLLTDDRNLRVKALARDVPVREVPDFIQWAGLG